ncbi:putative acyl-CoA thioester hydrolase [Pectobacteriaceae bacterium CE70]|nr:putative acyl-CoA thioester hydrolase [Pectobacteriaceae bacterium C52]WJV68524.1 putative acyl-CoA thioester hydrolase [Pectobacteriaceae bacterium CE70]WJY12454.1 putative acyl-CoA thioester hydrolase [Pectobacteriaceae bacterium C80]
MSLTRFPLAATAVSVSLLLAACSNSQPHDTVKPLSPGTATRPVLSAQEAEPFTLQHYLAATGLYTQPQADGWFPSAVNTGNIATPYVVGPKAGTDGATYTHIQQAVNAAIRQSKNNQRVYIRVLPGTYTGTVYIPADAPPMTLSGAGSQPGQVVIQLALDSMISPATYRSTVNAGQEYQPSDPAWYMYDVCASKQKATIDTICAAVMWSQSDDFQLKNLTVMNSLLDKIGSGTHQGVALRTDGDKVQLENVRLIGRQDTFFVNTSNRKNEYVTDHYSRAYIKDSYIEGDVDYVFGRATAVFDNVHFHTVSSRGPRGAYVFAPDTMPWVKYGFLVIHSKLTGDSGFRGTLKAKLGRAWDQGASKTGYLPGNTANGQLVIRDSTIDSSYDQLNPWGAAATTNRPFHGNISPTRDLNDVKFNRLWEYNNVVMTGHSTGLPTAK